jgi:3-keto-5-aminohexanoate cleavage enzyme
MEPLMITASCGFARPPGPDSRPDTVAEIVESVYAAYRAGACIAQVRAPFTVDPKTGQATTDPETWTAIFKGIRERCDILLHVGVAGGPIDKRIELLDAVRPEISSFLISHHDIVVRGHDIYQLLLRPDAIRLLRAHVDRGVVPAFEIFHAGALWNLEHCLQHVEVPPPLALTLFFWEGGLWAPPTVEELMHRIASLPAGSSYTVATAHGPEHTLMHALAIGRGGHVRVGFGDHYPFYSEGVHGQNNAQFVARMARLARDLNRELATPAVAAQQLGIRRSA